MTFSEDAERVLASVRRTHHETKTVIATRADCLTLRSVRHEPRS